MTRNLATALLAAGLWLAESGVAAQPADHRLRGEQMDRISRELYTCLLRSNDLESCVQTIERRHGHTEPGLTIVTELRRVQGDPRWRQYAARYLRTFPRGWMSHQYRLLLSSRVREPSPDGGHVP